MSPHIRNACQTRMATLGGFALIFVLSLPLGCVSSGDETEAESETSQAATESFTRTCRDGFVDEFGLDLTTMRFFNSKAHATSCTRNNGTENRNSADVNWSGVCFNDLSNRNGVITCAHG
jgi:hypothetical protein